MGERFWRFHGGLRLRHWKQVSIGEPLIETPLAERYTVPLQQHIGVVSEALVAPGDMVAKYQAIAKPQPPRGSWIHAPTSGKVISVEKVSLPSRLATSVDAIVIESDGKDAGDPMPTMDVEGATPQELVDRLAVAGVVGLGGALFPTAEKLAADSGIETLIINGAECEPYISCDEMLMRHWPDQLVAGSELLQKACRAQSCVIAIEDQMGAVEEILRRSLQAAGSNIQLIKVPTIYPEGGERQLIEVLTGKQVPSGGLPADLGLLVQNVATAVAAHDAVSRGIPLVSRIVSVTGRGISSPRNVVARIGEPIASLVSQAGGYTTEAERLVVGGPMMGNALPSDDVPVTKAVNCVLALIDKDIAPVAQELPCIRCMECVRACPAQLLPQQLLWHIQLESWDQVSEHHLADCIECGCCAYVCPSQIPLVDYYRFGKNELAVQRKDRELATHARMRYEAREERLARIEAERAERLAKKRSSVKGTDKSDTIAAAIERAKARKEKLSDPTDEPDKS